jgi:hypothetical protein
MEEAMPRKEDQTEDEEVREEAMPRKASPKPETPSDGLVKVSLGAETLHVHPDALQAHKKLGWKEA